MEPISIQVNGRQVRCAAEPRMHLGDFLRDELHLTGTHLGCEHGVCGACTVLVDGHPTRSCITFAVALEGSEVITIEGYDGDPVMHLLRSAFTRHHALQCGFCTPGMLATARDIVLRLPDADEARVRVELAGNLCRCTGYQGIVDAILDVLQQQRLNPDAQVQSARAGLRSPGSAGLEHIPLRQPQQAQRRAASAPPTHHPPSPAAAAAAGVVEIPEVDAEVMSKAKAKGNAIEAFFDVPHPLASVWQLMGDLPAVAACLPGATVASQEGEKVKGSLAIKFGPMSAAFAGAARLERDDASKRAVLRGAGQDSLSKSRAQGDISYRLESLGPEMTRVHIDMVYAMQGPLAQFSRSGLVKDFVRRIVADFGRQLERRLSGQDVPTAGEQPLAASGIVLGVIRQRLQAMFRWRSKGNTGRRD